MILVINHYGKEMMEVKKFKGSEIVDYFVRMEGGMRFKARKTWHFAAPSSELNDLVRALNFKQKVEFKLTVDGGIEDLKVNVYSNVDPKLKHEIDKIKGKQ